uniref:Potassium intermediate/small conductance calcium-activated channel, subfamily N, member 4 n=1 Tax=Salarias fasciatus TaxID=181472 RepID=A0A672HVM2_SALFA
MFLRLYLVHRAILLHSKVLLSASYRSIGSLNNINFTFRFVLKVLMNKHPARTLLVFILFFWLTASWMLTLCERQTREPTGDMDTALWLVAITFLTVGYGDVAPSTSCGRAVCLFTGVMGVACTAMLVAIVTEKLALNKGEKHVHFFMLDIQISKRVRACRVIFLQYKNTHNLDLKELIVRSMLNATASLPKQSILRSHVTAFHVARVCFGFSILFLNTICSLKQKSPEYRKVWENRSQKEPLNIFTASLQGVKQRK